MARKRKYIVIPGDPITPEELEQQLYQWRLSQYQFEMEEVRVSDRLTPEEKQHRRNSLMLRIRELEAAHQRS